MARNQEKAMSALARFMEMKRQEDMPEKKKRPFLVDDCKDVKEAIMWRTQVLRSIGKLVMEVQNDLLAEHKLRDLNDDINKLLREKRRWEYRIGALGGPSFADQAQVVEADGVSVGGTKGYLYFGAAKKLPGVKELLEIQEEEEKKKTRKEMYQSIDADYYGYGDEDDGILVDTEAAVSKRLREDAEEDWKRTKRQRGESDAFPPDETYIDISKLRGAKDAEKQEKTATTDMKSHVPLPAEDEIEKQILERKKKELLKKYANVGQTL